MRPAGGGAPHLLEVLIQARVERPTGGQTQALGGRRRRQAGVVHVHERHISTADVHAGNVLLLQITVSQVLRQAGCQAATCSKLWHPLLFKRPRAWQVSSSLYAAALQRLQRLEAHLDAAEQLADRARVCYVAFSQVYIHAWLVLLDGTSFFFCALTVAVVSQHKVEAIPGQAACDSEPNTARPCKAAGRRQTDNALADKGTCTAETAHRQSQ